MKVTYSPESGTPTVWDYVPAKVRQSEAEMMERRAGMTWDELQKGILAGSAKCRKVLLWHALRKDHPVLRWEDVPDFLMAEVTVEFDLRETTDIRAAVAASKEISDDVRVSTLEVLDEEIAKLEATSGVPLAPAS